MGKIPNDESTEQMLLRHELEFQKARKQLNRKRLWSNVEILWLLTIGNILVFIGLLPESHLNRAKAWAVPALK